MPYIGGIPSIHDKPGEVLRTVLWTESDFVVQFLIQPHHRAGNSVEGHIRVDRNATEYHGMLLRAWTDRWRSTRSCPESDIDHRYAVWATGNDLKRPARHAQVMEFSRSSQNAGHLS